jgi:hypothetical protein
MKRYAWALGLVAVFIPVIALVLHSTWMALTIGLIALGGFNYVEKLCNLEVSRRTRAALLLLFIVLSACTILYNWHQGRSTHQRVQQAEDTAAEAKRELEHFRAPRVLSPKEQHLVASRVGYFHGQEYLVVTYGDLKEPVDFSNQLHRALLTAGWKYIPPDEGGILLWGIDGVHVWVHPKADPSARAAATALVSVLEEVGQAATLELQSPDDARSNRLVLNVGTKP